MSKCTMASLKPIGIEECSGELELELELEINDIVHKGSVFISKELWDAMGTLFEGK